MNTISKSVTPSRILFVVYFAAWLSLIVGNSGHLDMTQLASVFGNALVIALFVGLGININAFVMKHTQQSSLTLKQRLLYIKENIVSVSTFFIIPFCVSSASSIVVSNSGNSLIQELFGTESHALIIAVGFFLFILIPSIFIFWRYGWDDPSAAKNIH